VEAASVGRPAGAGESARRVEAMVARHGPALLRVANQFSLCHDDALDAYQRGLEIYLRRLDTVDPATEGAWLRVVVKHEAMAIRRARQASVGHEDVDLDASIGALREVEDEVAGGERVERSVEALRALKPDEAKALMLKAQGLSYQEIGRRFGWTYTKVNRSITEGRRRFLDVFRGIEDGEACERHAAALAALVAGTASSAEIVALRPHLRHCAACRATMRELRVSRGRRIAALIPGLPWLARRLGQAVARVPADVQYAAATGGGGGRLGPAVAVLGVCLGGAGAAVCATGGTLPVASPLIAHVSQHRAHAAAQPAATRHRPQRHTRVRAIALTPTATPTVAARARATATPARHVAHRVTVRRVPHHAAARREFGFEGAAPAATATPAPVARAASASTATTAAAPVPRASSGATGSEFGFERGG
jgi:RNA polymerase sigma factor (sigma-70 family)